MKKTLKRFLFTISLMLVLILFVGCAEEKKEEVNKKDIFLSSSELTNSEIEENRELYSEIETTEVNDGEVTWDSSVIDINPNKHNVEYAANLISSEKYPNPNTMKDSNELNELFRNSDIESLIGTELTFIGLPFSVEVNTGTKDIRSSIDFLIEGRSRSENLQFNVLSMKTDGLGVSNFNPYIASGYIVGSKKVIDQNEHGENEYTIPSIVVEDIYPFSYEEYEYGYKGNVQNNEDNNYQSFTDSNNTGETFLADYYYSDNNNLPTSQIEKDLHDFIFEFYGNAFEELSEESAPKTDAEIRLAAISAVANESILLVNHMIFSDDLSEEDRINFKNIHDTFQYYFDEIKNYKNQFKEWETVQLWDGTTVENLLKDLKFTKQNHDNKIEEFCSEDGKYTTGYCSIY